MMRKKINCLKNKDADDMWWMNYFKNVLISEKNWLILILNDWKKHWHR